MKSVMINATNAYTQIKIANFQPIATTNIPYTTITVASSFVKIVVQKRNPLGSGDDQK